MYVLTGVVTLYANYDTRAAQPCGRRRLHLGGDYADLGV